MFRRRLVEQSSADEVYLWAKFQVENASFEFVSEYVAVSRKSSKTVITRERRNEGMNPFHAFHASSRSTCGQKMGPRGLKHLNMFPRELTVESVPTEEDYGMFLNHSSR